MKNLNLLINAIHKILALFLMFCMGLMVLTVVWQVFTRFVIHDPSTFTDELSRLFLVWIGILGGSYTFMIKRHLALEIILIKLPEYTVKRFVLTTIINCFIIVFTSVSFVYGGFLLTVNTIHHHQISPSLAIGTHHLLIGYVYVVVPIAGVLIIIAAIHDIIQNACDFHKLEEKGA